MSVLRLFVDAVLIIRLILQTSLASLLLEKTHQMAGVGKMEIIGQLADGTVAKQQIVFQGLYQSLLQQMVGRYSELSHYGMVQGNPTDMEHIGIFLNTLYVANMLFKQLLELIGIVVFRNIHGKMVGCSIFTIDYQ